VLDKKFAEIITRKEENRLEYVRWSLDRIEDAKYGQSLELLEATSLNTSSCSLNRRSEEQLFLHSSGTASGGKRSEEISERSRLPRRAHLSSYAHKYQPVFSTVSIGSSCVSTSLTRAPTARCRRLRRTPFGSALITTSRGGRGPTSRMNTPICFTLVTSATRGRVIAAHLPKRDCKVFASFVRTRMSIRITSSVPTLESYRRATPATTQSRLLTSIVSHFVRYANFVTVDELCAASRGGVRGLRRFSD